MSHQTRAFAWSALIELQDPSAGLRDVIGHLSLREIKSSYQSQETPRRFQEYAHELHITFDAIRFLSKVDSEQTILLQEDVVSAVAHFLRGLATDCAGEQSEVQDEAHRLILGHTFCSAVLTLRSWAWDCNQELRTLLANHSGQVLKYAPVNNESMWLIQTLADLLVSHYSSSNPLDEGADQSGPCWSMLWEAKTSRSSLIQEMVERATDDSVATADRILPILDLCQLYWDTEALLINACVASKRSKWFEKVFHAPSDTEAVSLAMEVRRIVQEQFAIRSTRVTLSPDKLKTQLYVMFSPGLRLACVSGTCFCCFNELLEPVIADAGLRQNDVLRSATKAAFYKSPIVKMSHDLFDQIYYSFGQRLRRWPQNSIVDTGRVPTETELEPPVAEVALLRPRLLSSHSVSETVEGRHAIEIKARSISQPNIHRRYSRPLPPTNKRSDGKPSQAELETQLEHLKIAELDNGSSRSKLERSCAANLPPQEVPPGLERTESVTTTTTSMGSRSNYSQSLGRPVMTLNEELESCFPEPVIVGERPFVTYPREYEESYPELAVDPVTAIREDNLSLFSESGSVPMTMRSASRVSNPRKFNLFKTGKRPGSGFAVPFVRFFASGKNMVAWTKYGGICFDVCDLGNTRNQPINVSDIVLGAGGTQRYGIIARYQEAYTLCVYNLGDTEPGIKINLGSCPKAMDLSKNDQYLAIKYAQGVRIFDLERSTKIDHKLPKMECANSPPGGHLVTFSHDSISFMASTRVGPEKVLTYWSYCTDRSKHLLVHSNAPCGNIDDHGLTSLMLAGPSVRGIPTGFLSTFTEKGSPVVLSMNPQQPHAVPVRGSRDLIGTRIHAANMHVDPCSKKSQMVMVNHNNDIFWVSDLFGRGQEISRLKPLKRPKSMKPELIVGMANADEANIFWIDQKARSGLLIKVGRSGGITKPFEIQLDIEPMCAG